MTSAWSHERDTRAGRARMLIERAHDELIAGNRTDRRLGDVRPLVRESWTRSLASLVGAEQLPRLDLSADELDAYRLTHPLAGVREMVRQLLLPGSVEDSGVVVALGDAAGRLLWVEGDRRVRTLTGDMGFVPGADWSEAGVGTSAPGTALALGRSVQIDGAEHFNRLVQPWSCTAAPVRDPETRQLIGVIDVTGGAEAVTPQVQLLVDAAARAVEGELLIARLRTRAAPPRKAKPRRVSIERTMLRVLGRDRALLEVHSDESEGVVELSARHTEILLMLAVHSEGLTAEALAELVYGDDATDRLRPEITRLRKILEPTAPHLIPESRPYRLPTGLDTDAQHLLSLLDRGAHRVALAAWSAGPVLPGSVAPGVVDLRDSIREAMRESLLAGAGVDVLLAYADTAEGADDIDILRECLRLLPARSPRRAGIVARLLRLEI